MNNIKLPQGNNENSFYIWQWLNLEIWAKFFLDNEDSEFKK